MSWRDKEFRRRHKFRKPQEVDALIERAYSNLEDDPNLIAEIEWKQNDPEGYAAFDAAVNRYWEAEQELECATTEAEEKAALKKLLQADEDMCDLCTGGDVDTSLERERDE